jgi:hypothetical protein
MRTTQVARDESPRGLKTSTTTADTASAALAPTHTIVSTRPELSGSGAPAGLIHQGQTNVVVPLYEPV